MPMAAEEEVLQAAAGVRIIRYRAFCTAMSEYGLEMLLQVGMVQADIQWLQHFQYAG